jgi:hypothetical protein
MAKKSAAKILSGSQLTVATLRKYSAGRTSTSTTASNLGKKQTSSGDAEDIVSDKRTVMPYTLQLYIYLLVANDLVVIVAARWLGSYENKFVPACSVFVATMTWSRRRSSVQERNKASKDSLFQMVSNF